MMGPGDNAFAWGGATAIRRQVFQDAGILSYWKNTISDDYTLSGAIHSAGLTIAYAPGSLVPSREHITAPGLLSWTRRQMILTRVYKPRQWWLGLAAHFIYCGAMSASGWAIGTGRSVGWWTLVAQLAPGMFKGARRAGLARLSLAEHDGWFRHYGWVHAAAVPLATWLWLIALLSSAFGNVIEWRGYRYRLKNGLAVKRV
jgi:hypothetical protein